MRWSKVFARKAVLMFVLPLLFSLVGCTSQGAQPSASQAPAAEEKPQSGGILKIHYLAQQPLDLDALSSTASGTIARARPAYSALVRYDPAKSAESEVIAPDIAERWEISADGKTLTFFLRKSVKWHDSAPFTAADVKYTFDRILDPKDPRAVDMTRKREGMAVVDKVEVVDDLTVRFLLKQPSASVLSWLGYGGFMIVPKHAWDKMDPAKDVMGTGPYRLKQYQPGVTIEYERNPDYFLKGRPYLDGVTEYFLKDNATRIGAFETKQLDLLRGLDQPALWEQIHTDVPEAQLVPWNAVRPLFLGVNLGRKPYDDPRVRKAIFLALDRRAGTELLVGDWGAVGGYMTPGTYALSQTELSKMPGYGDPRLQVAEAQKLMADAGYPQGFKANMVTSSNFPLYEAGAVWAKDQLQKNLKIDASIEVLTNAAYSPRRQEGQFDLLVIYAAGFFADPSGAADYWRPGNYFAFKDQELFDALLKQDRTLDVTERKRLVNDMERKLLQEGPYSVITWTKQGTAIYPWVKGHFESVGLYSNHTYDQVWLAK